MKMNDDAMFLLIIFLTVILFTNFDGYEYDLYDYLVAYLKGD